MSSGRLFAPVVDIPRRDGAFGADTGAYHLFKAEAGHYRARPAIELAAFDSARRREAVGRTMCECPAGTT